MNLNIFQVEDIRATITALGFFALMLGCCFAALVSWESWHSQKIVLTILFGMMAVIATVFVVFFALEALP